MKAREIAEFLSAELVGDGDTEITGVADLELAQNNELAFIERPADAVVSNAGCVIVPAGAECAFDRAMLRAADPKLAFTKAAAVLHPAKRREPEIHPTAVVAASARIGAGVFIGPFVCIGENSVIGEKTQILAGVRIGDNVAIGNESVLHPNVFVEEGCSIGDRVVLHAGVCIGAPGFGYVRDDTGEYHQFPQIGTVVIEDNVEIGANTCIDRGALGETRIGEGTKIDNLVQIAHNVQIGKRVVIAAQTGISGSTVIEDDCVIGGQVGMGDHARVQSGAIIGSQAGVLPGKIVRPGVWWGTPVQPLDEYKRQNAHIKGLARLKDDMIALKRQIKDLLKGADESG